MSGGQIAALIFAILLLLPGGCFLWLANGFATDENDARAAVRLLLLAGPILSLAGFLFWLAFRRRRPAAAPPDHSER
jgi:hypothetical protein